MPAVSKKQQRLFALARAVQKGKIPSSKVGGSVKDIAKDVSSKDVEDFASTPTKNLPQKVKKEARIPKIILKPGTPVKFTDSLKSGTFKGKIVRFDKGDQHGWPFYVISVHGKRESVKVPHERVKTISEDIVTEAAKKGDCYDANGRFMLDMKFLGRHKNMKLVHGVAILQTDGKPFGHCWLEEGGTVYDFSNGKHLEVPKQLYYALGQIPARGYSKLYKYDQEQVALNILKTSHWGPWDLKPPR